MKFTVTGNFGARLCGGVRESLSFASVKVYIAKPEKDALDQGYLRGGRSTAILNKRTLASRTKLLVGTTKTDENGNYHLEISKKYTGGPLEIHLAVTKIPGQPNATSDPIQVKVRRLQPVWRGERERRYCWNYDLPFELWDSIRSHFDAWLVCGHIKSTTDGKTPLEGVKVSAWDVDWIQDDFLGSCTTDASGYFRIDYSSKDYKKTFLSPLINIETPISTMPGPGLYFKVESQTGLMLYEEKKSRGKMPDRQNVPRCFYIDLYADPIT